MSDTPAGAPPAGRPARATARGLRRSASQAGLLAALLGVFTVCAATAATGALLVTDGNDAALSAAVAGVDGDENARSPDITTALVIAPTTSQATDAAPPPDASTLVPLTRRALLEAAQPYRAEVSVWTATPLLRLPGSGVGCGYLLDADTVAANAVLRSGRWPTAPAAQGAIPVAVPASTAGALGLAVGSELRLTPERRNGEVPGWFDVVVTGTFEPSATAAWERDTLRGRGYVPDYLCRPTFGPFVVSPGTLQARAAPVDRVAAVMDPDLAGDPTGVPALLAGVDGVAARIQDAEPGIGTVVVRSSLGAAFEGMRTALNLSNASVAAVFGMVLALGVACASVVARALVGRRAAETILLRDRGASPRQLVAGAALEAAAVAGTAALLAIPVAIAGYTATAPARSSAFAAGPTVSATLLAAALLGAALPATVAVVAAVPERPRHRRRLVSGVVARSGIDLLLVLVAAVTYVQLRSHVVAAAGIDPLLVAAPAVCALAVAAVATRGARFVASSAEGVAGRDRGVVRALAGWQLARGGAAHGSFLLVLATAVATLSVGFLATWSASQADQASAITGADLVVAQPGTPGTGDRLAALAGGVAAPVADRAVVLGNRPGGVRLVATDALLADDLLRGRLPGDAAWSSALAGLAPPQPGTPLRLGAGPAGLTTTGSVAAGSGPGAPVVTVTPTLVLVDDAGDRTTVAGAPVTLDGRPHRSSVMIPDSAGAPAAWHVIAIDLLVACAGEDLIGWGNNRARATLSVAIEGASSAGGAWGASSGTAPGAILPGTAVARADTVDASFAFSPLELSWQDAHLRLLSFPASTDVPVVMAQGLVDELGLVTGDRIALRWESTSVEAVLVRAVPFIPSRPREAALFADLTSLDRALLTAGWFGPLTDGWWVGSPSPGAAEELRQAGWGPVATTAELTAELRDGPLRAPLPLAWLLAIAAAVGLGVTGAAAGAAAQTARRSATIARIRALGVSRRDALAVELLHHAAITATAVLLGAVAGGLLNWLLSPLLVVDPLGRRAIPAVEVVWPAASLAAVVVVMLVGALLAGVPAALATVNRSTVAALRAGEAG